MARWMLLLQEFEFEVIHRPGTQHLVADYLSRIDSGDPPDGVEDDLPDAALFMAALVEETIDAESAEIPSIPWTWYEEMFHFLDTG